MVLVDERKLYINLKNSTPRKWYGDQLLRKISLERKKKILNTVLSYISLLLDDDAIILGKNVFTENSRTDAKRYRELQPQEVCTFNFTPQVAG